MSLSMSAGSVTVSASFRLRVSRSTPDREIAHTTRSGDLSARTVAPAEQAIEAPSEISRAGTEELSAVEQSIRAIELMHDVLCTDDHSCRSVVTADEVLEVPPKVPVAMAGELSAIEESIRAIQRKYGNL